MRKHFFAYVIFAIGLCTCLWSCDEIFDRDIKDQKVYLFAPSNNTMISSNVVMFKWNAVEGAREYRLQVVGPSFKAITSVKADTVLSATQFTLPLTQGKYQWTVSAINNTATAYSDTFSITVVQSLNLTESIVTNLYPQQPVATPNVVFNWDAVFGAKAYIISVKEGSWESGRRLVQDTITTTNYSVTDLTEKLYSWGVKAINDSTETSFSHYSFWVDVTKPGQSELISPIDGASIAGDEVAFKWDRAADSGSDLYDSLIVATNSQFSSVVLRKKITTTSTTETFLDAGTYYWRVKSCDAAGNQGEFSASSSFIKQ